MLTPEQKLARARRELRWQTIWFWICAVAAAAWGVAAVSTGDTMDGLIAGVYAALAGFALLQRAHETATIRALTLEENEEGGSC